jgi:hypothetical protein
MYIFLIPLVTTFKQKYIHVVTEGPGLCKKSETEALTLGHLWHYNEIFIG